MNEGRPQLLRALRAGFAILFIAAAGTAIIAAISQFWLVAVGSSLTAIAMAGSFWSTRPRRTI